MQYLYAAYSLKNPGDLTDPGQKAAVASWKQTIVEIAREEMGHLMTVQNLRVVLDLGPTLERAEFPMLAHLFPFDFHLGPLTQKVLAEYIIAESPLNDPNDPTIATIIGQAAGQAGMPVNHVGVLYALLGVVFAAGPGEIKADASGMDPWYEMVQEIADAAYQQDLNPGHWHLSDGVFDPSTLPRQARATDWQMTPGGTPIPASSPNKYRLWHVQDRDSAKAALRDIGLQGEGSAQGSPSGELSHFERFLDIYKGNATTPPFPAAGGWVPTYAIPTDPVISNDSSNPNAITDPKAQHYAALADARYALILTLIGHSLATDPADRAPLGLPDLAINEMRNLRSLSTKLVTPDAMTHVSKGALPFTLPGVLHPLPDEADRKALLVDRLKAAITLGTMLQATYGDPDPLLAGEKKLLQML